MLRACIYARFSTDRQSESSIDDQFRVCERRAAQEGLSVVARHGDSGVSGTKPVRARAGGRALLADALAERFDVLLIEGLDRLARDQVESESVVRRFEHQGIRIIGVSDGYDSALGGMRKVQRGVKALMNELYIDDLRVKTHRGLGGQFQRGYSAGGKSYGYRTVPELSPDGARVLGRRLEIEPQEAAWVRWIFERAAVDGWPSRRIVEELNRQGVAAPRSGTWAVSGLHGTPARGLGLLNNELYVGRVIWNRTQWLTDPDTGKRVWRTRPEGEWMVAERPDLRIVPDEHWREVRARMNRERLGGGLRGKGPPPKTLFAGVLRCGVCGGPMAAISGRQYGCVARKDRGPTVCAGTLAPRAAVDARLLAIVRDELLSPAALAQFQAEYRRVIAERRRVHQGAVRVRQQRRAELDAEISRVVDAIAQVGISPALAGRLRAAEAERAAIDGETGVAAALDPASADATEKKMLAGYRRKIAGLADALTQDRDRARAILAELFGRVVVQAQGGEVWAEIEGQKDERLAVSGEPLSLMGVAGAGFTTRMRYRVA